VNWYNNRLLPLTVKQGKLKSAHGPYRGPGTKTNWPTDHRSQYNLNLKTEENIKGLNLVTAVKHMTVQVSGLLLQRKLQMMEHDLLY
jgi:hypothetical protein